MMPFSKDYNMLSNNYISNQNFYSQFPPPLLQQSKKVMGFPNVEPEECVAHQKEISRLSNQNSQLIAQVKELIAEKDSLMDKVNKLEALLRIDSENQKSDSKKKRSRRVANEIERLYSCPLETCKKSYGSEGSLMQHIKLKHPDYFVSINETTQNYNKIIHDASAAKEAYENLKEIGKKAKLNERYSESDDDV